MCSNFVKTLGYEQLFVIKNYILKITKSDEENINKVRLANIIILIDESNMMLECETADFITVADDNIQN